MWKYLRASISLPGLLERKAPPHDGPTLTSADESSHYAPTANTTTPNTKSESRARPEAGQTQWRMRMNFGKNWRTSSAGIAALLGGAAQIMQAVSTKDYVTAGTLMVAGAGLFFAKDQNVTGGTVKQ